MSLTPILPFLHVQVPLVVGLDAEGTQIQALCLSPVNALQFRVLEHRTMADLNAFQEFWIRAVDAHACRHDHVAVAVPRYYRDPHGVLQWLYETGVQMEECPVLLADDWPGPRPPPGACPKHWRPPSAWRRLPSTAGSVARSPATSGLRCSAYRTASARPDAGSAGSWSPNSTPPHHPSIPWRSPSDRGLAGPSPRAGGSRPSLVPGPRPGNLHERGHLSSMATLAHVTPKDQQIGEALNRPIYGVLD